MPSLEKPQKIMIFGRPGSGKSTFAYELSKALSLPLHHLDKHFFVENWIERPKEEFLEIQKSLVSSNKWIIDGNSIHSLKMRWEKADLVLYFNFPKLLCLYRLFKRLFTKRSHIDDRAENCPEAIRLRLIRYMWNFENRVESSIKNYKALFPNASFFEIRSKKDLTKIYSNLYKASF